MKNPELYATICLHATFEKDIIVEDNYIYSMRTELWNPSLGGIKQKHCVFNANGDPDVTAIDELFLCLGKRAYCSPFQTTETHFFKKILSVTIFDEGDNTLAFVGSVNTETLDKAEALTLAYIQKVNQLYDDIQESKVREAESTGALPPLEIISEEELTVPVQEKIPDVLKTKKEKEEDLPEQLSLF